MSHRLRRAMPHIAAVLAVSVIGVVTRSASVLPSSFPLNDGGLFYAMTQELRETWPALPTESSYNDLRIPYAYPPLGFYLGAALHDPFDGVNVMRALPWLVSCLTVPAFYLLAASLLGGVSGPVLASAAFALAPRSSEWLIMGGGLTRATGMLLALLALWATWRLLEQPRTLNTVLAGVLGGATFLSHPQGALFLATAGVVFVGFKVRSPGALAHLLQAVAVAGLVVMPWLITILVRHGLEPILSAGGTQPGMLAGLYNLISLEFGGSHISPVIEVLAILGILISLIRGHHRVLALWFALALLFDSRGGATYAMVPAALLAGLAVRDVIVMPFWQPPSIQRPLAFIWSRRTASALLAAVLMVALLDGLGSPLSPDWPARPLTRAHLQAMDWVADDADGSDRYLVVSGEPWAEDASAEWFPVLTGAKSVATVQGTEWLGTETYTSALEASEDLRACATETVECLARWSAKHGIDYTHVFIIGGPLDGPLGKPDCCASLREILRAHPGYEVIYDGPGATVAERGRKP